MSGNHPLSIVKHFECAYFLLKPVFLLTVLLPHDVLLLSTFTHLSQFSEPLHSGGWPPAPPFFNDWIKQFWRQADPMVSMTMSMIALKHTMILKNPSDKRLGSAWSCSALGLARLL